MMSIASLKVTLSPGTSEAASDKRRISVETFMFSLVRWRKGLGGGFWGDIRAQEGCAASSAGKTPHAMYSASDDYAILSRSVEPDRMSELG